MTRIYQDTELTPHTQLALDSNASHHLARVLRAKVGEPVIIFNGKGGEYAATIEAITKRVVTVALGAHENKDVESPIHLYLAQGIARGEKMDFIIQKAVELGVTKIFPLQTERGTVKLQGEREAKRIAHWQAVVVSACEQCGRNRLPEMAAPQTYVDFVADVVADHKFVLSPHVQGSVDDAKVNAGDSIALLIGPEGGLSDAEVNAAVAEGYQPLLLGPRVLRTETATVAALTKLQAEFGDM